MRVAFASRPKSAKGEEIFAGCQRCGRKPEGACLAASRGIAATRLNAQLLKLRLAWRVEIQRK